MKTSDNGKKLIKGWEGYGAIVYGDPVGIATGGWGHVTHDLPVGAPVTTAQAEAWFAQDIAHAENAILHQITVPLNQNEFDALVSLVFNIGSNHFFDSSVKRYLNLGDRKTAAKSFCLWVKAGGHELPGLVRRREAEMHLFLTPHA